MKKLLGLIVMILMTLMGSWEYVYAQSSATQEESRQNQTEYMVPDLKAGDYNYYNRDRVSSPLMPNYQQDSVDFHNGKKKRKQQDAYLKKEYYYPAKPRNQWEIGINGGLAIVSGDVKTKFLGGYKPALPGYGVGLSVRKALGYLFSIRGQYLFSRTQGQNWEPYTSRWSTAVNGQDNPDLNYNKTPVSDPRAQGLYFPNYRTTMHEASLAGVLTLGNFRFHRERNKLNLYVFFGAGGMAYYSEIDQLDANGEIYDYGPALDFYYASDRSKAVKKEMINMLNDLYDGEFESPAEGHKNEEGIGRYVFNPIANVGFGFGFHLSKRMTINLEQRISWTNDDLLDGVRWEDAGGDATLTRDFDTYSYTFVSLNFHLGKNATEPLWWMNPMDHTYKQLGEMDPASMIEDLLKDDDDDGVPNKLDREAESPKGCPVDPKGVALDSDKDGCIDCLDKEPFSPPGYPIDENCVAIIPEPECCDNFATGPAYDCSKIDLPSVHFDLNKYYIKPEYFAHLHAVAEHMQMCPEMKVVAIGSADSRNDSKYNEQLSWNRVDLTLNYLVDKYGISRDRFIMKYLGESESGSASTEYEHLQNRRVDFRFVEDGETGNSNPPAPHPGLKAGSDR